MKPRIFFASAIFFCFFSTSTIALACPTIDGLADVNCDGKLKILAFGDSITFGRRDFAYTYNSVRRGYPGRLRLLFPNATVINSGVPGENSYYGKKRIKSVLAKVKRADYVIILEGVNDYFSPVRSPSLTRAHLLSMVRAAQATGAVTLLSKLTPVDRVGEYQWAQSVNEAIADITTLDFSGLTLNLLSYDGLHPNGKGYDYMANTIANSLMDISQQLLNPQP